MLRIALQLEYDGTFFHGWQYQPGLRTVQDELQKALSQIASEKIEVTCAGRTDKGVHAKNQIVHFDTRIQRPHSAWVLGTNHFLPKDISVRGAIEVPTKFHARHSAISRSYEYWIDNRPTRPAIDRHGVTWFPRKLDTEKMHAAVQYLIGEHNFSAFRAAECQAPHPIRAIYQAKVRREQDFIILQITANAFLHHMVRNIMGTLLPIGLGEKNPEFIQSVLASKQRTRAGVTAPPEGLYLHHVEYPKNYQALFSD